MRLYPGTWLRYVQVEHTYIHTTHVLNQQVKLLFCGLKVLIMVLKVEENKLLSRLPSVRDFARLRETSRDVSED